MKTVSIIGGGPAGLAAAIALRRKGFTVAVADARTPPIDKACGEGLMPDGVDAAEALGIDLSKAEPMRGVRFICGHRQVEAPFPGRPAYGFRRTALHDALACTAEREGVSLHWASQAGSLPPSDWTVRACGAGPSADPQRYGFRQHFRARRWTDFLEVYWQESRQIYITPVSPDEIGIAVLTKDPKERIAEALKHFPQVRSRLIEPTSSERGAVTGYRAPNCLIEGTTATIGDAAGTVDAITGEGLALSFRSAFALADALANNDPASYERSHDYLFRRPRTMAKLLLRLDWHPSVFTLMQYQPWIFRRMLAFHVHA